METVKRYLSSIKLDHFHFGWKSYQSLIGILITGIILIFGGFYFLHESKVHQFASLDNQLGKLESYMTENSVHEEKLEKPLPPNPIEATGFAKKVPFDRHVPEFLTELDNISKLVEVEFTKLEMEEVQPEQKDMVTVFLRELATLAKEVKEEDQANDGEVKKQETAPASPFDLSVARQRERVFVTDPERILDGYFQQAQEEQNNQQTVKGVTDIPQELLEYLPFGMIRFHVEFEGTYRQLTDFLGHLRKADRLVHVEKWDFLLEETSNPFYRKIKIDFKILYYKEKIEGIQELAPTDIKEDVYDPITILPKSWLEETADKNPVEIDIESDQETIETQTRDKVNELLKSYPQDSTSKD
ncbi:hypothetical protein [Ammoniphilus sp. YIM 78166]|uniref:hypothetical protein n=1 Tax=Ammoniphilus sp. YIM 78166 TaxID=1644106 RepID=UPI00106F6F94|nr:hypothetical protein [Ammoniphilus sp. YIM 78166]